MEIEELVCIFVDFDVYKKKFNYNIYCLLIQPFFFLP